ncbi:MAG: hypothetical protein Q8K60_03430 [Parachlamydiaceae bacterium]|nr:hypothetical protein [Parachlamydiaceae bacterium]
MIDREPVILKAGIEEKIALPKLMDGYTTIGKIETDFKGSETEIKVTGVCTLYFEQTQPERFQTTVIIDSDAVSFSLYDGSKKYEYLSFLSDTDIRIKVSFMEDEC